MQKVMRHLAPALLAGAAVFSEPLAAAAGSGLAGTWTVTTVSGQPVHDVTMTFEGGKVSGKGGCNRYGGSATVKGSSLTFGPMMATRMDCPNLAAETAFFSALEQVQSFAFTGATLTLRDGAGHALVALKR